jgi:hypothetical protein
LNGNLEGEKYCERYAIKKGDNVEASGEQFERKKLMPIFTWSSASVKISSEI